jgi:hypothetical protein
VNILLAVTVLAQVQVRDEPKDWNLLKTANFDLHYPADALLPRAREFAAWFEEARVDLVRRSGVEPPRVKVFLYRSFHDLMQSSFLGAPKEPLALRLRRPDPVRENPCLSCRPDARSRALALAEPTRNRIFIHCQASDRWNAWFIRHELAHQVQFEHLFPFRLPSWLLAAKDPLIPSWWWEGGADWFAGVFYSRTDQYMHDLAEERLYDLNELFFSDVINPHDFRAVYLQGSYFWRFLDEKHGAARKVFEAYDDLPVPPQKPLVLMTDKSRQELQGEFEEYVKSQGERLRAGRGALEERLTDTRAYYRRRAWGGRWSPDGKRLAWVGDADVWPEVHAGAEVPDLERLPAQTPRSALAGRVPDPEGPPRVRLHGGGLRGG